MVERNEAEIDVAHAGGRERRGDAVVPVACVLDAHQRAEPRGQPGGAATTPEFEPGHRRTEMLLAEPNGPGAQPRRIRVTALPIPDPETREEPRRVSEVVREIHVR